MRGVAHSHISISFVQLSLFRDCGGGAGQRRTSITAGNKMFTKCSQNHDRRFHDHSIGAMFMHTHEIQLIWHRHLHRNCEWRTPNLLHCNCPWNFGATFQAFYIWSEWCCIIHLGLANSFIYLALTGYVTIELESQIRQVGTSGLTEKPLNRRMIRRSLWLQILVWCEMVEQSSVVRGNLYLLHRVR